MPITPTPEQIPAINKFSAVLDQLMPQALALFAQSPYSRLQFLHEIIQQYRRAHGTYTIATLRLAMPDLSIEHKRAARSDRKKAHHLANITVCAIGKRQYFSEVVALDPKTQAQACAEAFILLLDSAFSPDPRVQDQCTCRQQQARGLAHRLAIAIPGLAPLFHATRTAA